MYIERTALLNYFRRYGYTIEQIRKHYCFTHPKTQKSIWIRKQGQYLTVLLFSDFHQYREAFNELGYNVAFLQLLLHTEINRIQESKKYTHE